MTRHCYTIKPAVSEGRASFTYGHTRLSQDEWGTTSPRGTIRLIALCIGVVCLAVIAAVILGAK